MSKRFEISSRPRANEVANALSIYTMFWGVPAILQADDGKGFKGAVLQIVKNHGVKVKNGRACLYTTCSRYVCQSVIDSFTQPWYADLSGSWQPTHI